MVHPSFRNVGAYVKGLRACSAQALAAGTGDATETSGPVVDRMVSGAMANSAVFMLAAVATLAAGKKCTLKATFQHDTDSAGGTMADVAAALQPEGAADSVVLTLLDAGAGGTQSGFYECNVNLSSLNRYIRAQVHIDLDAGATDIGAFGAVWVLGGYDQLPV